MGIFRKDYNKPGPGVEKDAPPKRGLRCFAEVLLRDFTPLVQLNLIYQLCLLPSQALAVAAILLPGWFWLFFILSIMAALPVGGAKTAVSFCVTKMLRHDPGFLWHDFKKIFRENFRQTALAGMLHHAITASQLLLLFQWLLGGAPDTVTLIFLLVSGLIYHMVAPYYFLQAAYIQLGNGPIVKNSLLLAFGHLPRSFGCALVNIAVGVAATFFAPPSLIIVTVFAYALCALVGMMMIWPPVDLTFNITETLKERDRQEPQE